jgi:hypothetical protein
MKTTNSVSHFIRLIILALFIISCGRPGLNKNSIAYTIDYNYMEGCETGKGDCKPVVLTRHSFGDSIKLIFPNGGTQSDVFLFADSAVAAGMKGKIVSPPQLLRHTQHLGGQGNAILDLTGLPDGKYRSQMLSCAVGGSFELIIGTGK